MANSHKNLTLSRAPVNVWEQPSWRTSLTSLATFDRERLLYGAGGTLLAVYGIRRGGWVGSTLAAAGAGIVTRAVGGHHDLTRARRWIQQALDACGCVSPRTDTVMDASDASFPASDAPSWTPTAGIKTKHERARAR